MSFLKKYIILSMAAILFANWMMMGLGQAQTIDSQVQELREKLEKEQLSLAKLVAKSARENVSFDNPMDALNDVVSQVQLDEKTPETVKNVNDIRESRYEMRREAVFQSFILAAKSKFDKESSKMDLESTVELVKTMPGESEGSGTYSEVLLAEMVLIMNYIRTELADLNREAAVAAAEIGHLKTEGSISETFNMCKYYTERRKKQSFLDKIKGGIEKATSVYQSAQETVSKVSEGIAAVNELKDTAQAVVNEAQSAIPSSADDLVKSGGFF